MMFVPGSEMLPWVSSANQRDCISDIVSVPPEAGCTKPMKASVWPMSGQKTFLYSCKNKGNGYNLKEMQ